MTQHDQHLTPERLRRAYGDAPTSFNQGVEDTLLRLTTREEQPKMKKKLSIALAIALIVTMLCTVAYAVTMLTTAQRFGAYYGEDAQTRLNAGQQMQVEQSHTVGDITYTLKDVVWSEGILYGTIVAAPKAGANVVLLPEDFEQTGPFGYDPYNSGVGEKEVPADAKSFRQVAEERGAALVMPRALPEGYGGTGGDVGIFFEPHLDGTVVYSFEVWGDPEKSWQKEDPETGEFLQFGGIDQADAYTLDIYLSAAPVGEDGLPNYDARIAENWEVTVTAKPEEAKTE